MDDLVTWLRGQLDEDERVAREAGPGPWMAITTRDFTGGPDSALDLGGPTGRVVLAGWFDDDPIRPPESEHIARWDPARVLAEVDAKRRILDEILAYESKIDGEWGCCHSAEGIAAGQCPDIRPDDIHAVRLLALPYADRPGYREEWRP